MKKTKTKVQYLDASKYRRVIAVSDLHGHTGHFTRMLEELSFGPEDALVIVGDLIEKGPDSLGLLRLVKSMAEKGNTFLLSGNNDCIFENWVDGTFTDEQVIWYVEHADGSILHEMANELGLPCRTAEDVMALKGIVYDAFPEEIGFLRELPHIIDCEYATFVHGGIRPGVPLEEQDACYCMNAALFAETTGHFDRPVVVGHWPASNYCKGQIDVRPHFNEAANIIVIDGGLGLKNWEQLNWLIFTPDGKISRGFCDELRKIRLLERRGPAIDPMTLIFNNTLVEERGPAPGDGGKIRCYLPYLGRELYLTPDRLYDYKGKRYCYDITTYVIPCEPGDTVSYCEEAAGGILIKKDGLIGFYDGKWE